MTTPPFSEAKSRPEESLQLLSDPEAMTAIRRSLRQEDEGDLHDVPQSLSGLLRSSAL